MRLIVVDPRHVGLANKADVWLRVRPGTDGALALGIANLMIERGWYDRDFIRDLEQRAAAGARRHRSAADRARRDPAASRPSRLGHSGRTAGAVRPLPAGTTATPTSRWRANTDRHATATWSATRRSSSTPRLCRRYPPEHGRGDLLDSARPGRGGRAADLARPAGLLLRLERPRAARQHHADGARDVAALCADRLLRRARRQRAVRRTARGVDHRRGSAGGEADGADAGPRRAPARAGALGQCHHPRSLSGDPRGASPIRSAA